MSGRRWNSHFPLSLIGDGIAIRRDIMAANFDPVGGFGCRRRLLPHHSSLERGTGGVHSDHPIEADAAQYLGAAYVEKVTLFYLIRIQR